MRVLYLADRLSLRGGADLHLRQVMEWAVAQGWRVTLGCGRVESAATAVAGVDVVRVPGLAQAVVSTARLGRLDALLAAADVVHAQNVMNPVALAHAVAAGRTLVTVQDHRVFCPGPGRTLPDGVPCREAMGDAVCCRCLPDGDYRRRLLDLTRARRDALAGAAIVVLSDYMARELAANGVGGAAVIPPWVTAGSRDGAAGDSVLLAGRLVVHKGVLSAWEAWRLAGRPLPLRVAGEGPLAAQLAGAVRLGWLAKDALATELARARMLLFPTRWQEPFGMLGVEALAMGTPVVVATSGGSGEWSDAGCLRVAPGDVAGMAAAVRRLANDPELASRLGAEGRRAVTVRFGRDRLAARLGQLYRTVAGP